MEFSRQESKGPGAADQPEHEDPDDFFVSLPPIEWVTDPSLAMDDDASPFDSRAQLVVKPIVVGDAVPPPLDCSMPVLHVCPVCFFTFRFLF